MHKTIGTFMQFVHSLLLQINMVKNQDAGKKTTTLAQN